MSGILMESRLAVRSLFRNPLFTTVTVITLALGIAANTAIFSVVNATLLRPLPYPDSDRLVTVWGELPNRNVFDFPSSATAIERYRNESTLFSDFGGAFTGDVPYRAADGTVEQISAAGVTWNLPGMLGVKPRLGRLFEPRDGAFSSDDVPEAADFPQNTFNPSNTAILSYEFWQRRFGTDPSVIGRIIQVAGSPVTVVGVMAPNTKLLLPPESNAVERPDVWMALRIDLQNAPLENVFLSVVGRMKQGVSIEQAQAEMDRISARIRSNNQILGAANFRNRLEPLFDDVTDDSRPALLMLFGAVGFVFLIACANVTGLLFVRATGRSRDTAIRAAIGGSRARLIRPMVAEAVVLAILGGLLGVGLAYAILAGLLTLVPHRLPRLDTASVDGTVLVFSFGISALAALLASILPAVQSSKLDLAKRLNGRGAVSRRGTRHGVRNWLVVAEVTLSFVLLMGAGLMARSFLALQSADPGFQPAGVLTFNVNLPNDQFQVPSAFVPFQREFMSRLRALPGVESVGAATPLPFSGGRYASRYATSEAGFLSDSVRQADYRNVLPGYFETMHTPLLSGRTITQRDQDMARPVAVVDDILARRAWPGENPVGNQLFVRLGRTDPVPVEVVGVVGHQKQVSLAEEGRETVFLPNSFAAGAGVSWTVRGHGDLNALIGPIEAALMDLNSEAAVTQVAPMSRLVGNSMTETRFTLTLIGLFAGVALVLAAVGLYGLLAYLVRQRTPEIGVRMSFGAKPAQIFRLVIGQGMLLAGIGVALGLLAAFLLARVLSSLLIDVSATDPVTYIAISLLFLLVTIVACAIPARRATCVSPTVALRQE